MKKFNRLSELQQARAEIERALGRPLPSWTSILQGARPPRENEDDNDADPGEWKHGWQFYASDALEKQEHQAVLGDSTRADAARVRSCGGRNNSRWLTTIPRSDNHKLRNAVHQTLLRRRLGLPIELQQEECEARTCREPLDAHGHHRSACMRTGRVHGRHAAALSPWKQILQEAGYRVQTERPLNQTHLAVPLLDQRRMDLVAAPGPQSAGARRGLALFCDLTVVSPHTKRGAPRGGARSTDGATIARAERRKHIKYTDVQGSGIAAFIVLGCEVYGRWNSDTQQLISELARLKALEAPPLLRRSAQHAWANRWLGLAGIVTQRAVAEALLCPRGADLLTSSAVEQEPSLTDLFDGN